MSKTPHYGIKFPITVVSDEKTMLDLNMSKLDRVRSELMHVIFTPKGQRLRDPNFGTYLIKFLFNPSDNGTWSDVVREVKEIVTNFVPDCKVDNIDVYETDNGNGLVCKITFTVKEDDGSYVTSEIITPL